MKIKKMPDKRTLETYLNSSGYGEIRVYFDIEKGEFRWYDESDKTISNNSRLQRPTTTKNN